MQTQITLLFWTIQDHMEKGIKVLIALLIMFMLSVAKFNGWLWQSDDIFDHQTGITQEKVSPRLTDLPSKICTILAVGTDVGPIVGPMQSWEWQEGNFFTNCSAIKRCRVTQDMEELPTADAVLIQSHKNKDIVLQLVREKSVGKQLFIYYTEEACRHRPSLEDYNFHFDVTANYQLNSDIIVPYGRYLPLSEGDARPPADFNYFEGKTRMVYWAVSHCTYPTRHRMETAYLLEKYGVKIHVAGCCGADFLHRDDLITISPRWPQLTNQTDSWTEAGKVYKFYFAAENAFSEDYITEKYWRNALDGNMIPIVQGGADYSKLAIPGSYIRVTDFDTIADLAKYIVKVANDQDLYNSYFRWKQDYKKDITLYDVEKSLLCPICNIAHNASYYSRSPVDLLQFSPHSTTYTSQIQKKHETMVLEATKSGRPLLKVTLTQDCSLSEHKNTTRGDWTLNLH